MFGKKKRHTDGCSEYPDGRIVWDDDVARYAFNHLRFLDRFNIYKITQAVLYSHMILAKDIEEPNKKNWKFGDNIFNIW